MCRSEQGFLYIIVDERRGHYSLRIHSREKDMFRWNAGMELSNSSVQAPTLGIRSQRSKWWISVTEGLWHHNMKGCVYHTCSFWPCPVPLMVFIGTSLVSWIHDPALVGPRAPSSQTKQWIYFSPSVLRSVWQVLTTSKWAYHCSKIRLYKSKLTQRSGIWRVEESLGKIFPLNLSTTQSFTSNDMLPAT